ncbi:uncharacterized protein LOC115419950 [Sphaeramia orbicularis]|uniref:uncharacterized protein LOC115419950 n=1 Tax=Sphaeramia orbicularis TaxID=375764 RepID=UPI0011802170|nr:uncharacterized protein LOC115419950 [Sphaeramia orbicularis]
MSYDKSTQQTTVTDSLLQTSCPDCFIGKTLNSMNALFLLSRRQNVNDDELNEFVKQAECLKYKRPVVFNTDHDYENCKPVEEANEEVDPAVQALLTQKVEDFREAVINCIKNYFMSLYGFCKNESQTLLHDNNRLMSYDKSTQQTTVTDSLLQTSCPDCFIGKTLNSMNALFLLSRRQNVNDDELNEFVKQAECLKYKRPVVFNTDHDYENCKPVEEANEEVDPAVQALLTQKVEDFREAVINCIKNYFMSLYQSIANVWS